MEHDVDDDTKLTRMFELLEDAFWDELFTDFERRVYENLDEAALFEHLPDFGSRFLVRTDGRADGDTAVTHDLGCNEANSTDVRDTIIGRKSESL